MLAGDREADIFCQFTKEGKIIPVRIRFADDSGEQQEYKILGYRETSPLGITSINNVRSFDCKIESYGQSRVINVIYFKSEDKWCVRSVNNYG